MTLNFVIFGASGRMGKEVVEILKKEGLSIVAQIARKSSETYSTLNGFNLGDANIAIDFSLPAVFDEVLDWCVENKIPLVSGTTGLSESQFQKLEVCAKKIPILWAPNMSLGIALLNEMIQKLALISEDYDFQIEEFHHRHKKDKPSGTGLFLQETLKETVKKEVPEVLSIRGGGIFGVHKVWAMSEEETLCFEHSALNRSVFAKGAVKAAQWLAQQEVGLYKISHVLNQ